jgi:hypothetical protein
VARTDDQDIVQVFCHPRGLNLSSGNNERVPVSFAFACYTAPDQEDSDF